MSSKSVCDVEAISDVSLFVWSLSVDAIKPQFWFHLKEVSQLDEEE
jgi:hypothetical protein